MAKAQISATVDEYVSHDVAQLAVKQKRSFSNMVEIALEYYRDAHIPKGERSSEGKGRVTIKK